MTWTLHCPWCHWYIVVNNRGGHGNDQGAGVEAADLMEQHVVGVHQRTWREFVIADKVKAPA